MKIIKSLFLACALASTASGAVTLSDTYDLGGFGGAPTDLGGGVFGYDLTITGFTAAGTDKLVLMYSSRYSTNSEGGAGITSITYGGNALTNAIYHDGSDDQGRRGTGVIAYLDNVTVDGNLRIELDASEQTSYSFGLFALNGTAAGVSDTASSGSGSTAATVAISTSTGFTLQEAVRNNQSLTPDANYTTLHNLSSGSDRILSQYKLTSSAGDYSASVGNTAGMLILGASFDAIPEPSTALLGALSLLMLLRRRR